VDGKEQSWLITEKGNPVVQPGGERCYSSKDIKVAYKACFQTKLKFLCTRGSLKRENLFLHALVPHQFEKGSFTTACDPPQGKSEYEN